MLKHAIASFFLIYFVFSFDAFCSEDICNKKSYSKAIAGALILPAVGHGYIGGDNVRRGLYYTGGEALNFVMGAYGSLGGYHDGMEDMYWAGAIHLVSMLDAIISVYRINNQKEDTSCFIATAGSAIFPNIGLGYLGTPSAKVRGWIYSFGEMVSFFSEKKHLVMGIRVLSTADAAYSAQKKHTSKMNVIFRPGIKSGYFLLQKSF